LALALALAESGDRCNRSCRSRYMAPP
jgi:hypothetical protein